MQNRLPVELIILIIDETVRTTENSKKIINSITKEIMYTFNFKSNYIINIY